MKYRKKKNFYLDLMMELTLKRAVIALALVFIFIFLPLYMFNVEPYDPKQEETTLIQEEGRAIYAKKSKNIETKRLNVDANPTDSAGYVVENPTIENSMPSKTLFANKTVSEPSDQKLQYIYNTTEDIDRPSTKISPETIENRLEGKRESALPYDGSSQNILANKPSEIETQKNDSLKIEDNRIEKVENQAKEKLHISDKLFRDPEIKSVMEPALDAAHSDVVKNIKIKKKKITDIKSHVDSVKEKKLINDSKPLSNLSGTKTIARVLLTTRLVNKEPVDNIKSPVIVSNNIITKLYFFTEILNMKGEVLYHYWMWDGNIELEKEIKISGNRWRAASLKMIPYSKTGLWQVRLVNEVGDILNEIQFEVVNE